MKRRFIIIGTIWGLLIIAAGVTLCLFNKIYLAIIIICIIATEFIIFTIYDSKISNLMKHLHRLEYESSIKYMRFYSITTSISLFFTVVLYSLKSNSLTNDYLDYKAAFSTSYLLLKENFDGCKIRRESPGMFKHNNFEMFY